MNFRCYIPYGANRDLLKKAVDSILPQINELSTDPDEKKVVVINNCFDDLSEIEDRAEIMTPPVELMHAQECNWMMKTALSRGEPFCMSTHTDSELLPGAMQNILEKYEQVKDSLWGLIFSGHGGHIFSLANVHFHERFNIWYDPFLFPFYYMDNHMHMLMELRGYRRHTADSDVQLVKHVSSHFLKDDPVFRRKNDLAFRRQGELYTDIWGGYPGQETRMDPLASGILPASSV